MAPTAVLIFGSGPGIGFAVANLFASRGFSKVILMSRNETRLAQEAETLRKTHKGVSVDAIRVDAADAESVQTVLSQAQACLSGSGTQLECVLFNTSRPGSSKLFEFEQKAFEADLRTAVVSLYAVAQWAMPHLLSTATSIPDSTPSILVTSGMLAKDPFPAMFSLAACKAAQYSLTHSLFKEFEPKGVHCSLIVVGGTVAQESKVTNPNNIAEETWNVFRRPRRMGKLEILIEDPDYEEHTRTREQR